MTLKESEFKSVEIAHCEELNDIKVEDEQDLIPADKILMIHRHQERFEGF